MLDHEAILADYRRGDPCDAIARRHGCTAPHVSNLARKAGIQRRERAKRAPKVQPAGAMDHLSLADAMLHEIVAEQRHRHATASALEIRRLANMGRKRTEIAALLRCPYREVEAALS